MNRQIIYQSTGGRCFYCGCILDEDNFHIDHVIPKALGGTDYRNVVPACPDCNMSKGTLSIEEFRKKIFDMPSSHHIGRMISKYYDLPLQQPVFWFEKQKR